MATLRALVEMSNDQNSPHKHHYIPQFWTKRWTGDDGLAQRFVEPVPGKIVTHRKPPAAIGWVDKLYEFPNYNRTQLNFESLLFSRIDQRASDVFSKLTEVESPHLNAQETEALAVFLTTLIHRTPAGISAMRELSRVMFEEVQADIRHRYLELRHPDDPPTVEEFEAALPPDAHLDYFSSVYRTVALSERIGKFLAGLTWKKFNFSYPDHNLLIGDDPLIRTNGLATESGHVALPLAPRVALIGTYRAALFGEISSLTRKNLVKRLNTQAAESARNFIVDVDEKQSRFIVNHFGRNKRQTISEQSLEAEIK